jgi:hypothetical protein
MASAKWMPYSYSGAKWGPCPIDVYYAEFERRYAHAFDDTSSSAREARGRLLYFQFYYLALYVGLSSVVMVGEVPNTTALAAPDLASDAQLWQDIISNVINPLAFNPVAGLIVDQTFNKLVGNKLILEYLGDIAGELKNAQVGDMNPSAIDAIKRLFKGNQPSPIKGHEVAAGVAALSGIVLLVTGGALYVAGLVTHSEGLTIVGGILLTVGLVSLQIVMPLITIGRLINAAMSAGQSFFQASKAVLSSSSAVLGVTKAANVVGLVIAVGIIWGFSPVKWRRWMNAVQISMLVALAIAQTILAILMFVLATVVGCDLLPSSVDFLVNLITASISGWLLTDGEGSTA